MAEKTRRRRAKQGGVYRRIRNGRTVWVGQYDAPRGADGERRRKTVTGRSQGEVVAKLKQLATDADAGRVAEPGQLTVADLAERFLAAKERSIQATTLSQWRHMLTKHVNPRLGGVRLAHLTPLHIEGFLKAMGDDFAALAAEEKAQGKRVSARLHQRRQVFDVLRRCLAYGERVDVLQRNPADRVERPEAPDSEVRALSAEQATKLLDVARASAPPWVGAAVALGLCGLRKGEVFGLAWGDVDLDAREVRVRQALKRPAKGPAYLAEPKTKAARRTVPLTGRAVAALRAHRAHLGAVPMPAVLMFQTELGGPIQFSNFDRRVFRPLATRAGLPSATFHMLRHTFCTLLLGEGVDVRTVAGLAGHAQPSETLNTYADFIPDKGDEAVAGLDALLGS